MTRARPEDDVPVRPDRLGATPIGGGRTRFVVWAPRADRVEVVPHAGRAVPMTPVPRGYHVAVLDDTGPGTRYRYRLHRPGREPVDRADPASRWQPDGLHGPSAVDDPDFAWTDQGWHNPPLWAHVLYEVHVGTFTPEGTFDALAARLGDLVELGVTAVELMPVWQFPGTRNWGYDGVLPYAVQDSYGGPAGLRRLVDAAHAHGLAVLLDVVYNHFGPEGFHLTDFGPYLTDRYSTPWGAAVNVDGAGSDEVRRFLTENAARWVTDFHLDGLRLDAVHAIHDTTAVHLLEELAAAVHTAAADAGRTVHVVAESDANDPRLVRAPEVGGYGLDAQWNDDFHHAVHALTTGEREGYYADYGTVEDLARLLRDRYALAGRYSTYRRRRHGAPARDVPYHRFVVCVQNHDQVGNRMLGERLNALVDLERRKLAAAVLLLSPFTPLLFMGEEHAEPAPFQYFVSHTDPALVEAVRSGRREEFAEFAWHGEAPDPQAVETFERSRPDPKVAEREPNATLRRLYRELLRLRRDLPPVASPTAGEAEPTVHGPELLSWRRATLAQTIAVVANFSGAPARAHLPTAGHWSLVLDTAHARWQGSASDAGNVTSRNGTLEVPVAPAALRLLRREDG